jgi:hypothetical protein
MVIWAARDRLSHLMQAYSRIQSGAFAKSRRPTARQLATRSAFRDVSSQNNDRAVPLRPPTPSSVRHSSLPHVQNVQSPSMMQHASYAAAASPQKSMERKGCGHHTISQLVRKQSKGHLVTGREWALLRGKHPWVTPEVFQVQRIFNCGNGWVM